MKYYNILNNHIVYLNLIIISKRKCTEKLINIINILKYIYTFFLIKK